jgi:acetyltransferase-like isoleucine patch superfamily enzyme
LRRDHRPFFIKKARQKFEAFYVRRYLQPQFDALGNGCLFIRPWHVEVFGGPIVLGKFAHIVAASDGRVRLSVWAERSGQGGISIGDYCLVCPGVRISSGHQVSIGDNCMFANGVYVTDSDWHDVYNRISVGKTASVKIGDNVWVGDGAIVCKGVNIGNNSVVGAGAVVVNDVPPNSVAAGNPARVVKELDDREVFTTREVWFRDPERLFKAFDEMDRQLLKGNSIRHWLRYLLFPRKGD